MSDINTLVMESILNAGLTIHDLWKQHHPSIDQKIVRGAVKYAPGVAAVGGTLYAAKKLKEKRDKKSKQPK